MSSFFKIFIRGIIVTLCLPFIVAFLALYTVYLVIVYVVFFFRNTVVFFMGGSIDDTKEDIEAKRILNVNNRIENNAAETLADIMHQAIAQNPEAIQAMAQQQIAIDKQNEEQARVDALKVPESQDPFGIMNKDIIDGGEGND